MRLQGGKLLITKRSIGQIALLVFAFATPAQTWAQADTSKQKEQADAAQTFRQGRLLDPQNERKLLSPYEIETVSCDARKTSRKSATLLLLPP